MTQTTIYISRVTGERFAVQSSEIGHLMSGPLHYTDAAAIIEGERVGESVTIDGDYVDSIPCDLAPATDAQIERSSHTTR